MRAATQGVDARRRPLLTARAFFTNIQKLQGVCPLEKRFRTWTEALNIKKISPLSRGGWEEGPKFRLTAAPQNFFGGKKIPENLKGEFFIDALGQLVRGPRSEQKRF